MKKPEQKKVRYIGGLRNLFSRTSFYISIFNFCMLCGVSYQVIVKQYFSIPLWIFIGCAMFMIFLTMVFEYTIMMPSEISFMNIETYKHNNPIKRDLEEIKKDLEYLKKKVK